MVDGKTLMQRMNDNPRITVRGLCEEYGLAPCTFYRLVEPLGYKKKPVKPKNEFFPVRATEKWEVRNRILLGLILVSGKTMTETAKEVGVDIRTLERWIYDGAIPTEDRIGGVCSFFGCPPHVLFYESCQNRQIAPGKESE